MEEHMQDRGTLKEQRAHRRRHGQKRKGDPLDHPERSRSASILCVTSSALQRRHTAHSLRGELHRQTEIAGLQLSVTESTCRRTVAVLLWWGSQITDAIQQMNELHSQTPRFPLPSQYTPATGPSLHTPPRQIAFLSRSTAPSREARSPLHSDLDTVNYPGMQPLTDMDYKRGQCKSQ